MKDKNKGKVKDVSQARTINDLLQEYEGRSITENVFDWNLIGEFDKPSRSAQICRPRVRIRRLRLLLDMSKEFDISPNMILRAISIDKVLKQYPSNQIGEEVYLGDIAISQKELRDFRKEMQKLKKAGYLEVLENEIMEKIILIMKTNRWR